MLVKINGMKENKAALEDKEWAEAKVKKFVGFYSSFSHERNFAPSHM